MGKGARSVFWVGCLLAVGAVSTGCAPRKSAEQAVVALPPPIYCYRTLAEADCHAYPLAGESYRLIAYY